MRTAYCVLFAGLVMVGLGSAWYHLQPDNASLVYDRLPIAIVSMTLLVRAAGRTRSAGAGPRPGQHAPADRCGSVIYWQLTEQSGHGDLRFYLLVAVPPTTVAILLLWKRPSRLDDASVMSIPVIGHGLAKACESADASSTPSATYWAAMRSKHLIAALGLSALLWAIKNRRILRHRNSTTVP